MESSSGPQGLALHNPMVKPERQILQAVDEARVGAQVVAEGIETEGEIHALRDLGVRFGQGIFFGAALKADD